MQQFPHPLIILDLNLSAFADGTFVGFILSTIFFGVTLLQAWNYALSNNDGWIMRTLVASLVALDIATTSNNVLLLHTYLIQHFGNLLELTMANISFIVEIALTATVVFLVQLFFASRVYILNQGDYRLPCAIVATACLGFVCSCYAVNTEITHREVADLTILPIKVTFILGQSLVTTSDGITTLALSVNFIRARSEINTKNTISILESLLAAVVARGVLVTVLNGLLILLYILYPMKLYWLAVQLIQSKLYIITLIAMLNARKTYSLPTSVVSDGEIPGPLRFQTHRSEETSKNHHSRHISSGMRFASHSQGSTNSIED